MFVVASAGDERRWPAAQSFGIDCSVVCVKQKRNNPLLNVGANINEFPSKKISKL